MNGGGITALALTGALALGSALLGRAGGAHAEKASHVRVALGLPPAASGPAAEPGAAARFEVTAVEPPGLPTASAGLSADPAGEPGLRADPAGEPGLPAPAGLDLPEETPDEPAASFQAYGPLPPGARESERKLSVIAMVNGALAGAAIAALALSQAIRRDSAS